MPLNVSSLVYLPAYDTFARTITVIPLASQPGVFPYAARGIFTTESLEVGAEDGSIVSDQRTILDIREAEFSILPKQGDQIIIPSEGGVPDAGTFEVVDSNTNGGGETTLTLRNVVEARPV